MSPAFIGNDRASLLPTQPAAPLIHDTDAPHLLLYALRITLVPEKPLCSCASLSIGTAKGTMLMNEAGEVSIDGLRAGTIAEQVLKLAGGCICCDTKDEAWSIAQLVQDYE